MEKLVLTEEIINCFKKCIQYRDFRNFFQNHREFIGKLTVCLKKIVFEKNDFCRIICENAQLYFDYLENWDKTMWNDRFQKAAPEMHEDLRIAMLDQNFDSFYSKYRSDADYIIERARRQRIMDFRIERGSNVYESFAFRDFAANIEMENTESIIEEILRKKMIGYCKIEKLDCLERKFEAKISSLKIRVDQKLFSLKYDQEKRNRELETKILEMEALLKSTLDEKFLERRLFDQKLEFEREYFNQEIRKMELSQNENLEELERTFRELKLESTINQEKITDLKEQFENELENQREYFKHETRRMELSHNENLEEVGRMFREMKLESESNHEKIMDLQEQFEDKLENNGSEMWLIINNRVEELNKEIEEMKEDSLKQEENIKKMMLEVEILKMEMSSDSEDDEESVVQEAKLKIGELFDSFQKELGCRIKTSHEPDQSLASFDEEIEKEFSAVREEVEQLVNDVSYRSEESNAGNIAESTVNENPSNPEDDDDEIEQMNRKFQQELDEQNRVQDQKLQAARERREEINRKAREDLKTATELARGNTKGT